MSRKYKKRRSFLRVLLGWMVRVAVVVVIVILAMVGYKFVKTGGLSLIRSAASADSVSDLAELIDSEDVTSVITNWSGTISAVTGVEYDVIETESGTYVQVSAQELSDLAATAESYLSQEDLQKLENQYGISLDSIAAGDYSQLGLSGDETYTFSMEEVESLVAMAQQYLGN